MDANEETISGQYEASHPWGDIWVLRCHCLDEEEGKRAGIEHQRF
jgi:hypothetical protein